MSKKERGGAILAAWRVGRGYSTMTAAKQLGVVAQAWNKWESGCRPGLAKALEIELLTGIPIEAFGYESAVVDTIRRFAMQRAGAKLVMP